MTARAQLVELRSSQAGSVEPRKHVGENQPWRDTPEHDRCQEHKVALAYDDDGDLALLAPGSPATFDIAGRVMASESDEACRDL